MKTEEIKIDDLKIGETYNVRVKVSSVENGNRIITNTVGKKNEALTLCSTNFFKEELPAFSPVSPAPKYAPCRLFKKGDRVRIVEWNGRNYCDLDHHTELKTGCIAEISDDEEDEQQEGYVSVIFEEYIRCVPPCYLELVTPVEELEPYSVKFLQAGEVPDTYYYWAVMDDMGHEVARFWHEQYEKGQAEAAAKAECARLNAEYRKECNNA